MRPKPAACCGNTGLSISSTPRHRNRLAGSLAERLERDYDDLLNEDIRKAEVLLGITRRFRLSPE